MPATPEPRITNLATHPKHWVSLTVAAEFLSMSYYSLHCAIEEGTLHVEWKGRRRKVHVDELRRFEAWQRKQIAS
jgi:hypothetical protein